RDIDWGIPIPSPLEEELLNGSSKRLYVWFDAVIGYLSASIEWARRVGAPERWREWWNDPSAVSYYFQGKDNITFHSQIWPAELLGSAGRGDKGGEPGEYGVLGLPTEVVASEFMTLEGKQFSTSRKHVIYVQDIVARYGPDPLLHLRRRPREPGRRLQLGRVRPAQQQRARRRLGQPRQPHRRDDREEL